MPHTARVAAVSAPIVMSADPVFAAIEAHREALSEFTAEVHYAVKKRRGRWCSKEDYRTAFDAYETATSALVSSPVATLSGVRAFSAYVADLRAYGNVAGNACCYAVEVWHLSDAMATVSAALARLLPAGTPALAH